MTLKTFKAGTQFLWLAILVLALSGIQSTCKYGFTDAAPPPADIKTFKVNMFENRAPYNNPQLAPTLTEKVRQKIISTTKLINVNTDDADYDISGYISQYNTSTVSIANNNSNSNRLTITFHLIFKNRKDDTKDFETDISRSKDFPANQTLSQAESDLTNTINSMADEVFNKIFSNW